MTFKAASFADAYLYRFICIYIHINNIVCIYMYILNNTVCIYMYIHMYMYIHTMLFVCIHTHMYIYIYVYTYMYTYTYIYIYIYICKYTLYCIILLFAKELYHHSANSLVCYRAYACQ